MSNTIFNDAKDVHVRNHVVFGKSADSKLYTKLVGTTYSEQLKQADLEELFSKKMLVVKIGENFFEPVYIKANKVGIVDSSSNTVTVTEYAAVATPA